MIPTNPMELFTPFLPTTYNVPEVEDRLDVFLVDSLSNFADVINDKRIGTFTELTEAFNGEKWAYRITSKIRNGYQAIAYVPSLPNTGTLVLTGSTFPIHNINQQFVVTQVWGSASKPPTAVGTGNGDFFSFFGQGNSKISFTLSDTTLTITTTVDLSAYIGLFVIQYLRDGL